MIVPAVELDPVVIVADCNVPASLFHDTVNDDNVPTLVIFGCAAVVTVPAVVALPALPAEPETLIPHVPDAFVPVVLGAPIVL